MSALSAVRLTPMQDRSALNAAKILTFDIETIPATVMMDIYDLRLRSNYIHHSKVVEPGRMFSWAAKWYHEPHTVYTRDHRHPDMYSDLWRLLDEASYVVTYNGDRFDLRKVRGYFAREGFAPFRPAKSIDLIKTVRTLGFESASLDYTARMLGVRRKIDNGGAGRIRDALAGDESAYKDVRTYGVGDVRCTEDVFDVLRPYIPNHPIMGYPGDDLTRCPRCCSSDVEDCGVHQALVIRYRMYRCNNCTGPFRTVQHSRAGIVKAL